MKTERGMIMQEEHEQILRLFYSGQPVNIALAEQQAIVFGFDLEALIRKLLAVAEECGWAMQTANRYEVLSQLLSRRKIELRYLHKLPAGLALLPNLEELEIEHFTLRELPAWLGDIQNLRVLRCSWGLQCARISPNIGQLAKLEELYLDDNALEGLPDEIGQLQNLRVLSLRNNCLLSLPESVGQLPNLRKLYLASNQLQKELLPSVLRNKQKSNPTVVNALRRVFKW